MILKKRKEKVENLEIKIDTKVCIIREVKKVKRKNKLINQNQNTVKKRGRKIKIRIPVKQ